SENCSDCKRDLVHSESEAKLLGKSRVCDKRCTVKYKDRRAESLDDPENYKLFTRLGDNREPRTEREDRESYDVDFYPPENICKSSEKQETDCYSNLIALSYPKECLEIGVQ